MLPVSCQHRYSSPLHAPPLQLVWNRVQVQGQRSRGLSLSPSSCLRARIERGFRVRCILLTVSGMNCLRPDKSSTEEGWYWLSRVRQQDIFRETAVSQSGDKGMTTHDALRRE
jgi:hypothetical protein